MNKFPVKITTTLICLDCSKKFEATIGPEEPDSVCPDCGSEFIDLTNK